MHLTLDIRDLAAQPAGRLVSFRTLDNAGDATAIGVADLVSRNRLPDPIPVTGSRWSVVAAFSLAVAATQMIWLTFAPVTTVAADRYGVSEASIGWLANVFVLGFVLLAIPAGFLIDRNLRGALMLGAAITAVGACMRLAGDSFYAPSCTSRLPSPSTAPSRRPLPSCRWRRS